MERLKSLLKVVRAGVKLGPSFCVPLTVSIEL